VSKLGWGCHTSQVTGLASAAPSSLVLASQDPLHSSPQCRVDPLGRVQARLSPALHVLLQHLLAGG